ncbi:hypothetical protein AVEN_82314-1 [Araneus ventricosus]|uniref:Uncharacterized protein n=1 Tax=Araneus ventricosus TaxID=182803 RepID=A0A4Y2N8K5_ARAVE|nr:hypothetical protein AVEN_82314-1 [Araneus ventricosus]
MTVEAAKILSLEKFQKKRSTIRGLLTKTLKKVNEQLELSQYDEAALNELLEQLCEKSEQIFELDSQIENCIDDLDQLETEVISNQEIREKIVAAKSKINLCLKPKVVPETNGARVTVPMMVSNVTNENSVRLPKLISEPFDGRYENCQEFWGQFMEM